MAVPTKDINTIISHPYLIYKESRSDWPEIESHIQPSYVVAVKEFDNVLDLLINQERTKETTFFKSLCSSSSPIPPSIKGELTNLFNSGRYSEFATYLDAFQKNLVSDKQTVKQALQALDQYYSLFTFKKDEARIRDFFAHYTIKPNQSIAEVFEALAEYLSEGKDIETKGQRQVIQEAVSSLKIKFETGAGKRLGPDYRFSNEDLTTKSIKSKTGMKTLNEWMASVLRGLFGGSTGEVAIDGKVTGMLTSKSGLNPDTDVVQYWSASLTRDIESEGLVAAQEHYEDLAQIEQDIHNSGGFVIHYSAKFGEGTDLKVKGDAGYDQRLKEIRGMLEDLHAHGYEDFLFTFANTVKGFIADDRWEDVKTSLIQFVAIWMFDDIIPDLRSEMTANQNVALNFYNIRGKTIVSSELFQYLKDYFDSLTIEGRRPRPAPITITRSSYVFTDTDRQSVKLAEDPWQKTYDIAMSNMKMGLKLKGNNVIQTILDL